MSGMETDADVTGRPRTPTARGDRAQRHRDVLHASAAVLDERGWDGFSIREAANRAGVSAGAVYQWFSGKGEIWARLQTARFIRHAAEVDAWPTNLEPAETVRRCVAIIAENHAEIGRHRFDFVRGLEGRAPEYSIELTVAHHTLTATIGKRLVPLMPATIDATERQARMSWLWATAKGVGDHLVDDRFEVHGIDRAQFMEVTTRSVLAGLIAP